MNGGPYRTLRSVSPLALIFFVWIGAAFILGPSRLPGPLRTAQLLWVTAFQNEFIAAQGGGSHGFAPHIWSSLWHVVVATSPGVFIGIIFTLAVCQHPGIRSLADTLLEWGRTLPPLLFVPFAAAALGASDLVRFISIGFYSSLTIAVYGMNASSRIPEQYFSMARLLGASRMRRIFTVELPAMIPHMLGPVRLVYAFSLGISIVVEYVAAPSGIGRAMKQVMAYSNAGLIVVGVVWTLILALLLDVTLVLAFSTTMKWTNRRNLLEWIAR